MPLTDRTLLHDPSAPKANVEPIVLFSIIDHYSRRDAGCDFVVGTLIGTEEGGVVTISSCFPVPHTEVEDQIALNSNFHTTMLGLHSRIGLRSRLGLRPCRGLRWRLGLRPCHVLHCVGGALGNWTKWGATLGLLQVAAGR